MCDVCIVIDMMLMQCLSEKNERLVVDERP